MVENSQQPLKRWLFTFLYIRRHRAAHLAKVQNSIDRTARHEYGLSLDEGMIANHGFGANLLRAHRAEYDRKWPRS